MTDGELHALNEVLKFMTAHLIEVKSTLKRIESRRDRVDSLAAMNRKLKSRVRVLEQLVDQSARREFKDLQDSKPGRKPKPK